LVKIFDTTLTSSYKLKYSIMKHVSTIIHLLKRKADNILNKINTIIIFSNQDDHKITLQFKHKYLSIIFYVQYSFYAVPFPCSYKKFTGMFTCFCKMYNIEISTNRISKRFLSKTCQQFFIF